MAKPDGDLELMRHYFKRKNHQGHLQDSTIADTMITTSEQRSNTKYTIDNLKKMKNGIQHGSPFTKKNSKDVTNLLTKGDYNR